MRRRHSAFLLLITLALAWMPYQASAQLLPPVLCIDLSPPSVSITSPANGATVSGTTNVTANASDDCQVAGVQFKLDGANLGAEDTAAPYAVSWNTATTNDGSHTLTAVARDGTGKTTTSAPVTVTVSNAPPAPTPVTRYEETDPSVSFGPGWIQDGGLFGWSGGSAQESQTAGAQATFTFTGTSVAWLGMRGPDSGIARVSIDGVFVSQVDMFARSYEVHVPVFVAKNLANGTHTLTITVTGLKSTDSQAAMSPFALAVVDAFEVPAHVVSHIQDTDPDWSYSGNWTFDDTTRSWSGWMASISSGPGAQASLPFNGTSISWIGYRGPDAGIAQVFIDGALAGTVDLYFSVARVQPIVFTSAQLADGNHTLTIVATGTKNASSSGTLVVVDAIDVNRPGTRFEETEPAVSFAGSWVQGNLNRAWSLGTIAETGVAGATASFTFTGTEVSWIGCRKLSTGIADVYLDGVFQTEIDTFQAPPIEAYQHTIYKATGLANGSHTLTIVVTGRTNPAATNNVIVIDAFDVRP
jgi:Bacterial Ig domain